jgi:hypothetical protein
MTLVRRAVCGLVAICLVSGVSSAQAPRPRAQRVDSMTASIAGTITAADTGAPVRGAEVRVSSTAQSRLATTDGDGRFELPNLPAGQYRLTASSAGFSPMQFGQRRPLESPTSIELAEGASVTADLALVRGGAIFGRILDQYGEPVPGTRVQVLRSRMVQGRRRLQSIGPSDQTDDTGAFRVYGLPPGEYYLTASIGEGDAARREPPIYYPGTANFGDAQPIALALGSEASADFQVAPIRSARVSGVVLSPSGAPAAAMIKLTSEAVAVGPSPDGGTTPFSLNADAGPDGAFTFENVPPGPYTLTASGSFLAGASAALHTADASAGPRNSVQEIMTLGPEMASMPLVITGDDVSDVTLTMGRGGILSGTFVPDAGVVQPLPAGLRVTPRSTQSGGMSLFSGGRREFRVAGLSVPFHLDVQGLPEDWAVSEITVDGVDVTDEPIDLRGRDATARVVLTDRVSSLSGTVQSREGSSGSIVVVFPEDPSRWTYPSRYVKLTRGDDRGRFLISALPPNQRYYAIAVDYLEDGEEQDPQVLERLRDRATSVSLADGEQRAVWLELTVR